jgi:hypothetical protein
MRNKRWITQKIRQCLILVVVFLLIYPGNLAAKKQKPGAQLQIAKLDGDVIKGELLRVQDGSLLLMTTGSQEGISIEINEIDKIMVKRKSKFLKGVLKGALIGGTIGVLLGGISGSIESEGRLSTSTFNGAVWVGKYIGGIGALTGGIFSLGLKNYKTIQVKGKSPSEIKKIIKKLKKGARFNN